MLYVHKYFRLFILLFKQHSMTHHVVPIFCYKLLSLLRTGSGWVVLPKCVLQWNGSVIGRRLYIQLSCNLLLRYYNKVFILCYPFWILLHSEQTIWTVLWKICWRYVCIKIWLILPHSNNKSKVYLLPLPFSDQTRYKKVEIFLNIE